MGGEREGEGVARPTRRGIVVVVHPPHRALSGEGVVVCRCRWPSPCILVVPPVRRRCRRPPATWPAEASSSSSGGGLVGRLSSVASVVVVRHRACQWKEGEAGVREGVVVGRHARKEVEVDEGVRIRV